MEKDAAFHVGQRGSGIQPRTLELFNFISTLPDVMQRSMLNKQRCIYEMPEGRKVAKIVDMTPYLEPTPDVPFVSELMFCSHRSLSSSNSTEECADTRTI